MAVERSVKKIRPADRELSQVQDNLANHLQQVVDVVSNAPFRRSIFLGTYSSISSQLPTSDGLLAALGVNVSRGSYNQMTYGEIMAVAGSVTSIKMYLSPEVVGKLYLTLYINGKASNFTLISAGKSDVASAAPGKFRFAAKDVLQLGIRTDNPNLQTQIAGFVEIESQA